MKEVNKEIKRFNELTGIRTKNNFLAETVDVTANDSPMIPLNEISVKRLLDKHFGTGFIIISANRNAEEATNQENNEKTRELVKDIRNRGYSYTPLYGGFIETMADGRKKDVFESSFLVFSFDRKGDQMDFDELNEFGIELTRKYGQDSFLSKAPDGNPKYINSFGQVTNEFKGPIKINDLTDQFFSSFVKTTRMDPDQTKRRQSRFTFTEAYVNPRPVTYNERHQRWLRGEVFLMDYPNKR